MFIVYRTYLIIRSACKDCLKKKLLFPKSMLRLHFFCDGLLLLMHYVLAGEADTLTDVKARLAGLNVTSPSTKSSGNASESSSTKKSFTSLTTD